MEYLQNSQRTYLQNKNKFTDIESEFMAIKGEERGINWEYEINMHMAIYKIES